MYTEDILLCNSLDLYCTPTLTVSFNYHGQSIWQQSEWGEGVTDQGISFAAIEM